MASLAEDESFKKTQVCLRMVAKEFKHQGYAFKGPCNDLRNAGKKGKYAGNVARDFARVERQLHLDQAALNDIIYQAGLFPHIMFI